MDTWLGKYIVIGIFKEKEFINRQSTLADNFLLDLFALLT